MAEIMSVLFFHTMRYKVQTPKDPSNDRFILSKGHAAPILYAGMEKTRLYIFISFFIMKCMYLNNLPYLKQPGQKLVFSL
jgi:hypothetical protein